MRGVLLSILALLFGAGAARAEEQHSLAGEIVHAIRLAQASAPYRSWDDLRVSAPRSVRWHLAPPDRQDARIIRRTGWIAVAGRQAGVAACGVERGPELLTYRFDGSYGRDDAVMTELARSGRLTLERRDPTILGETTHYSYASEQGEPMWFRRELSCTAENARSARRCEIAYVLDVRPNYASAPRAIDCAAP